MEIDGGGFPLTIEPRQTILDTSKEQQPSQAPEIVETVPNVPSPYTTGDKRPHCATAAIAVNSSNPAELAKLRKEKLAAASKKRTRPVPDLTPEMATRVNDKYLEGLKTIQPLEVDLRPADHLRPQFHRYETLAEWRSLAKGTNRGLMGVVLWSEMVAPKHGRHTSINQLRRALTQLMTLSKRAMTTAAVCTCKTPL